ncbi:MAG: hypothetical protein QOI70_1881 [Microbacteriaceae bacterium]|jgi:hypothetical protein|nr:hypothetical protein [Microbacteriaceae bacterium]
MTTTQRTTRHVALIHTVPALAASFDARILAEFAADDAPRIDHIVDPWLLAEATRHGVTDEIAARVAEHAAYLARQGATLVMVTCSSIGGTAAGASDGAGIPVLRVDGPMARQAVDLAAGGTIAVLATLTSTLKPTAELIRSSMGDGQTASIETVLVEGAAAARASGDTEGHDELIRAAVKRTTDATVVVLAQASMAPALEGADLGGTRVLTSPPGGVAGFVDAIRALTV